MVQCVTDEERCDCRASCVRSMCQVCCGCTNPAAGHMQHMAGLTYLDKGKDPKNPETKTESRELVDFTSYVDSVYLDAPEHVELVRVCVCVIESNQSLTGTGAWVFDVGLDRLPVQWLLDLCMAACGDQQGR